MKFFAALFLVPSLALAASGSAQTHHCVKDGQTIEKTKKDCKKEGGKWEKNAKGDPAAAMPATPKTDMAPPTPAPAPAPAPAAK